MEESSPGCEEDIQLPSFAGYIEKQSPAHGFYQRRFFVLDHGVLTYFVNASNEKPKGAIPLDRVVSIAAPDSMKIELDVGHRLFRLRAESSAVAQHWLDLFQLTKAFLTNQQGEEERTSSIDVGEDQERWWRYQNPTGSAKETFRTLKRCLSRKSQHTLSAEAEIEKQHADLPGTFLNGYLEKRSPTKIKVWQKRWCVLQHGKFFWFKNRSDTQPKACIPLENVVHCEAKEGSSPEFHVDVGERVFVFRAQSIEWRQRWLDELRASTAKEQEKAKKRVSSSGSGHACAKWKNAVRNVVESGQYDEASAERMDLHKVAYTLSKNWWKSVDQIDFQTARERYIPKIPKYRLVTTLKGHSDAISCLAVHKGKMFSGSWDGTWAVWDLSTLELECVMESELGGVFALLPYRKVLFTGSFDRAAEVWTLDNSQLGGRLTNHRDVVGSLEIMDETLYTGSWDKTINAWTIRDWRLKARLTGHEAGIGALKGHATTHLLYSGSGDCTIKVWDTTSHTCLHTFSGHTGGVVCLEIFEPYLLSGGYDKTIRVWSLESRTCLRTLYGHIDVVSSLKVKDTFLFSASWDQTIRAWNLENFRCDRVLKGHSRIIRCLASSQGRLLSGDDGFNIMVWEPVDSTCTSLLSTAHTTVEGAKAVVDDDDDTGKGEAESIASSSVLSFTGSFTFNRAADVMDAQLKRDPKQEQEQEQEDSDESELPEQAHAVGRIAAVFAKTLMTSAHRPPRMDTHDDGKTPQLPPPPPPPPPLSEM
eukprot:TRINITY_DN21074_c0_g2_i1.p1 TRINITY_DN21074_c0_g2~~TRINITY_DN21074_c0_g2_i1.p1  ORF type:complete len:760 (-),score=139.12 TRINITY_DN21074_c0_g2_i1:262-2541(-)